MNPLRLYLTISGLIMLLVGAMVWPSGRFAEIMFFEEVSYHDAAVAYWKAYPNSSKRQEEAHQRHVNLLSHSAHLEREASLFLILFGLAQCLVALRPLSFASFGTTQPTPTPPKAPAAP